MKEMTKLVPVLDWVKELWLQESLPLLEHEIITALGSVAAPVQQLGTQTLQQLRVEIEQRPTVSAAELQASSDAQDFAPQDQVHSAFSRTLRWSRDDQALLINGELFTPEHCRYPSPLLDSVPQLTLNKQGLKQSFLQGYFAERYGDCHDFNAVADFLREWFSSESVMQVQTSGSTGTPKKMQVEKERMCNSAALTLEYLHLKGPQCRALACMSLDYIGGKMVVVRSLLANLQLLVVPPCGLPLRNPVSPVLAKMREEIAQLTEHSASLSSEFVEQVAAVLTHYCYQVLSLSVVWKAMQQQVDFAAMVPLQVFNCIRAAQTKDAALSAQQTLTEEQAIQEASQGEELASWSSFKKLIIGGGEVSAKLLAQLQALPTACYSTYGMTETLSHIALRKLNGDDASEWYYPFPRVELSTNEQQCLKINAPLVCAQPLQTNDVVTFNDQGGFQILGRLDNVINTGGVKVQTEMVEKALQHDAPPELEMQITSRPDDKFGRCIVLLYHFAESSELLQSQLSHYASKEDYEHACLMQLIAALPKYWRPKYCCRTELPRTATSKPDRATAAKLAASLPCWPVPHFPD